MESGLTYKQNKQITILQEIIGGLNLCPSDILRLISFLSFGVRSKQTLNLSGFKYLRRFFYNLQVHNSQSFKFSRFHRSQYYVYDDNNRGKSSKL